MAKRIRGSSSEEDSQYCNEDEDDRISMLTDELLLSILSRLPFKQVAAASALSRRWRHLWTFSRTLDFDGLLPLLKKVGFVTTRNREPALCEARSSYVAWVDRVTAALQNASTLHEFRVFFNLNKAHEKAIDGWIRYALGRKVQRLELDLTDHACTRSRVYDQCYTFPYHTNLNDLNCLTKLSMNYVNVNGDALNLILRNSPLLQDLSVSQSGHLTALKINGPFPALKRLKIALCHNLKLIEIRDVGLVSFLYRGSSIHFLLQNLPLLVNVFIGGMITRHMEDVLLLLSSYLSKIETLTLHILGMFPSQEPNMYCPGVKMSHLKELVVRVHLLEDCSLLPVTDLLRMSPRLQRFVVQASHSKPVFVERKVKKIVRPYPHLKEIKFEGYCGVIRDEEFVMHFLDNATSLEKIEIDPRKPCVSDYHYAFKYEGECRYRILQEEMAARNRANEQLTNIVPTNITLNIL